MLIALPGFAKRSVASITVGVIPVESLTAWNNWRLSLKPDCTGS